MLDVPSGSNWISWLFKHVISNFTISENYENKVNLLSSNNDKGVGRIKKTLVSVWNIFIICLVFKFVKPRQQKEYFVKCQSILVFLDKLSSTHNEISCATRSLVS